MICAAGIDLADNSAIRPVPPMGRLYRPSLSRNGGMFDIGSIINLGPVVHVGRPPELEDRRFEASNATTVREAGADEFWQLLLQSSRRTLQEIFGPELRQRGYGATIDEHRGVASLGLLRPILPSKLFINARDKLRIALTDGQFNVELSVTDLRLYEEDQVTIRRVFLRQMTLRMLKGVPVILSVGLARSWKKEGDNAPRHWLQVNNIHLEDNPLWTDRP